MYRSGLQLSILASCAFLVQMVKIERLDVEHMTIGEGPHWDVKSQSLYFVDIRGPKLFKYNPATNKTISIKTGKDPVGFIVPVKDKPDHFVIGEKLNLSLVHWNTTKNEIVSKELLVKLPDPSTNRLNDGKCDAHGRLWFGTMTDGKNIKKGAGFFYSYTKKEGLKTQRKDVTISNGIAISANNEKFWYIDSPKMTVDEFDFNIIGAEISYVKPVFDYKKNGIKGLPDGMTIDANGNLWVACFGSNEVLQINPLTSELLQSIKFPAAHQITSVMFGGSNLDELYVTSADEHTTAEDRKKHPESGSIYKVTELGVKGVPAVDFDLDL